ncbi:MAG: WXG100 family type VII secretion target [Roseburia sp.]|nr:WXG100 family type VII secretion target [Roseburia sp.]
MAGSALGMNYDDMEAELQRLSQLADDFESTTTAMTASVNTLCDNSTWTSASTQSYREDYEKLTTNFTHTLEIVRDMVQETHAYIQDMQATDNAHSTNRVQ